ncbi:MAG: M48 family metallopeptidase [Clostridiales bacterium]|nr:M48 family metallopeptidase [Clostridiales bacterium]
MRPDCIIRTNRRSMSLSVSKDGKVIVRAPRKLDINKIFEFVNEKESWINKHLNAIKNTSLVNHDIKEYNVFLFLGNKYKLRQVAGIKQIEFCSNEIIYPTNWDKEILIAKMKKKYRQLASSILNDRIEYFAKLMQLDYNTFAVRDYKARWGCCSKKLDIVINYKAIMLPHVLIDYILIHELSHIIEFNHSSSFYKIIESVMPDWKKNRKKLKDYDFLLGLF